MWFSPSPVDDDWEVPAGKGHKFLLKYLLALQSKTYKHTILEQFSHKTLTRNMKLLCTEYSDEEIKRSIALCCLISDYPFSTKLIKEKIIWLKAIRSSPIAEFYRNRS